MVVMDTLYFVMFFFSGTRYNMVELPRKKVFLVFAKVKFHERESVVTN